MIELILTVCVLAAPSRCDDVRLQFVAQETMMQCMMQAPPYIAAWSAQHPDVSVSRWRSAWPGEAGRRI